MSEMPAKAAGSEWETPKASRMGSVATNAGSAGRASAAPAALNAAASAGVPAGGFSGAFGLERTPKSADAGDAETARETRRRGRRTRVPERDTREEVFANIDMPVDHQDARRGVPIRATTLRRHLRATWRPPESVLTGPHNTHRERHVPTLPIDTKVYLRPTLSLSSSRHDRARPASRSVSKSVASSPASPARIIAVAVLGIGDDRGDAGGDLDVDDAFVFWLLCSGTYSGVNPRSVSRRVTRGLCRFVFRAITASCARASRHGRTRIGARVIRADSNVERPDPRSSPLACGDKRRRRWRGWIDSASSAGVRRVSSFVFSSSSVRTSSSSNTVAATIFVAASLALAPVGTTLSLRGFFERQWLVQTWNTRPTRFGMWGAKGSGGVARGRFTISRVARTTRGCGGPRVVEWLVSMAQRRIRRKRPSVGVPSRRRTDARDRLGIPRRPPTVSSFWVRRPSQISTNTYRREIFLGRTPPVGPLPAPFPARGTGQQP